MSLSLLAPGAVVAGYRIESVVGRGGMGVVYRASDLELERVVALKVIAPELLEDAGIRERFLKEARSAASIEHPNVIPVYAAGERDGVAYLAMRLIDGVDLKELVRRDGPPAPGRATDLIARAAAGLDAIHRAGYVHRDVKPANVLVDRDGHVYVTDFGLAKQMLSTGAATGTGRWVGTLDYVAPEQIRAERVDARADVYALGGVLAYLLTGRVPFEREADEAKLWAQLSDPPPVPSRLRPELPRSLDAVVARAMAKAATDRYPSAGDLGRAARAAVTGDLPSRPERMVARGAAAPDGGLEVAADGSTVTSGGVPSRPSRRRVIVAGLGAAGVAVLAIVVALAISQGDSGRGGATRLPRVMETIPNVGHRPNGVVLAAGVLWVTSDDQQRLDRIDAATGRELEEHPVVGSGASDIVTDGTSVWVAAKGSRRVVQIDATSGRIMRRIVTVGAPWRLALGFGSLWLGTSSDAPGADRLVRYDLSGNELGNWPIPRGISALAADSAGVWIAERKLPYVERFDPRAGSSTTRVRIAGRATVLYAGAGYVWATLEAENLVARIDPGTTGVANSEAGHRPAHVVAAGGRIYVASNTDHAVLVFDPRRPRQVGAPLEVDPNPRALAAGPRSIWVTGVGENTLTRIAYR